MKSSKAEIAAIRQTVLAESHILEVPLDTLMLSDTYQARIQDAEGQQSIAALAATIEAVGGLLQNLVVVARDDGRYEVCAGGRRWRALNQLQDAGKLVEGLLVPVRVIATEHAHHASLIENHARADMHPADLFVAYKRLRDEGRMVEFIAAAHGATVAAVRKLLALGDVSPRLIKIFREGKANLADMYALAGCAEHERQEAAWKAAQHQPWNRAHAIRSFLAEGEIRGEALLARFVTVAAYEKAGGAVRQDLFAEANGKGLFLQDGVLLEKLAIEKLQRCKLGKAAAKEGWAWLEFCVSVGHDALSKFGRILPVPRAPTEAEAAAIDRLKTEYFEAVQQLEALECSEEEEDEAEWVTWDEKRAGLENQIEVTESELRDFDATYKTLAGAIVYLGRSGDAEIVRGLVRPEDRTELAALENTRCSDTEGDPQGGVELPPTTSRPVHSDALVRRLQAQRVIATQAALLTQPKLVLALCVAQLASRMLHVVSDQWNVRTVFDLSASSAHHDLVQVDSTMEASSGWQAMQEALTAWTERLPQTFDDLIAFLITLPTDELMQLQALLLSVTVYRQSHRHDTSVAHLDLVARLTGLDMTAYWSATAETYFDHVSKSRITEVVAQVKGEQTAAPIAKMKKGDAAQAAETALAGTGWLPEPLIVAGGTVVAVEDEESCGEELDD